MVSRGLPRAGVQGKNSFTQMKAQSLVMLEEIVRTIVHPATIVEVKYAYMRLLTNVYAQSDVRSAFLCCPCCAGLSSWAC